MLSSLVVLVCLAFLNSNVLAKAQLQQKIVGGHLVDIEDFPYQVSLQKDGRHDCGGALLSREWILTAGHCASGSSWETNITLRIASSFHDNGGVVIPADVIERHPEYSHITLDYDFTLIKLQYPVPDNLTFAPVKLVEQDEDVEDGELMSVSGWGEVRSKNESADQLRAVELPKVNQELCKEFYGSMNAVTERMLCAGFIEGGKGTCFGDSGGPLVSNGFLVGVVSWAQGCAQPNYPTVFGRVAAIRDWIEDVTDL